MNKKALCLIVLLSVFPVLSHAKEISLENQLVEAKNVLKQEEGLNKTLKEQLASKEQEVVSLREKIKVLEEGIKKLEERSAELERGGV